MITGSHNQQIFWYATGHDRVLGQLPAAYLVQERRWIPRRMAVLHPPSQPPLSETGHWNSTCIACHATHGKPQFDTPFGSQPISDAVGADHGRRIRNRLRVVPRPGRGARQGEPEPAAAIPAALHRCAPTRRSSSRPASTSTRTSQVCAQCHSVWEFYDADGERLANAAGLPFRPGDGISDSRFVAQPTQNIESPTMKALLADDSRFIRDAFWADGIVRVSGREYNGLIESPCYRNARAPSARCPASRAMRCTRATMTRGHLRNGRTINCRW